MKGMHYNAFSEWNEYTPVYYGTDTYPEEEDPYDRGSKPFNSHLWFIFMLFALMISWSKKMRRRDLMLIHPTPVFRIGRSRFK